MRRTHSTQELDARLRAIGAHQLGLVTAAQALNAGVGSNALARRRACGSLVDMFPHVMRLGASPFSPQQQILAAALAVPGSTIAATSAAIVHGMPLPAARRGDATDLVLSVTANRPVRIGGITAVRLSVSPPSTPWMNARLAAAASALLLLPRFVDARTTERCLDHCLAHRLTTVDTVRHVLIRMPTRAISGRRFLLSLLDARTDGIGHRSGKEQYVGGWLNAAGLPGWTRNYAVPVGDDGEVEVDFGWRHRRVALEVSPFFTHGSRITQERDVERRRLLVLHDWRVVEAVDADLASERAFCRTAETLRRHLAA